MAKVNLLSDFDVEAIALVTKGANRKRFFMRKSGEEPPADLVASPHAERDLIAKADWSRVYGVVAEPGWQEDPGQLAGGDTTPDEWASEEEIRKAQRSFVLNGAKVNKLHTEIAPYGLVVENAIALDDFTLTGPDGEDHTIRKGSWYVAIEPTEEGKALIESGEFSGISLEGTATRTPVEKGDTEDLRAAAAEVLERIEKAETFSKPGTADVTAADRKKIKGLAMHYLAKPHPFTACKRDQIKHGLTPDHANRRCAVLLDTFDPERKRHSMRKASDAAATIPGMSARLGEWIAKKLGASDEELATLTADEEVEKGPAEDSVREGGTVPEQMERSEVESLIDEKLEGAVTAAVEKSVKPINDRLAKLAGDDDGENAGAGEGKGGEGTTTSGDVEKSAPSVKDLSDKLDQFIASTNEAVEKIGEGLDTLAAGESEQVNGEQNGKVEKSATQALAEEIL